MPNPGLEPEVKASIQAAILQGKKNIEIAQELRVSVSSVCRVKATLSPDLLERLKEEEFETITGLITQQLTSSLEATIEIAEQCKDANWRGNQKANELGVLYGVLSDKTVRLLEASENAARAEAERKATMDLGDTSQ